MRSTFVVIATRGRPSLAASSLDCLATQSHPPTRVVVVGVEESDVTACREHSLVRSGRCDVLALRTGGLCAQRNAGVAYLRDSCGPGAFGEHTLAVFFDDDFRPDRHWLECAVRLFDALPEIMGLTGRVLADGAKGEPLAEVDARRIIADALTAEMYGPAGLAVRDVDVAYGCNMAFRATVFDRGCLFDERLALYGWQEDQDFSAQVLHLGRIVRSDACRGVHLGTRAAKVSGVRLGYSQIANPAYLIRKRTMPLAKGTFMMARHFASNMAHALVRASVHDYNGRLRGNVMAIYDPLLRRDDPARILRI